MAASVGLDSNTVDGSDRRKTQDGDEDLRTMNGGHSTVGPRSRTPPPGALSIDEGRPRFILCKKVRPRSTFGEKLAVKGRLPIALGGGGKE